jgi:hypothetical protein
MRVSFFPIRETTELGVNAQLEDLDSIDSHCER